MRRPPDEYDKEDLERIKPEPWQLELLTMNPEYCSWGPHEDVMSTDSLWGRPLIYLSWKEFRREFSAPDNLNECVSFYFEIERKPRAKAAHVNLVLWMLHPRKGASRGIEIGNVQRDDLLDVFRYLRKAAERGVERFSKLSKGST